MGSILYLSREKRQRPSHIGKDVLSLIRSKKIDHATATLKGGPAKRVFDDGKEAIDTSDFSVYLDLRLKYFL